MQLFSLHSPPGYLQLISFILLLPPCVAALGHLLQFCYSPGEIFGRYGLWLHYQWRFAWRQFTGKPRRRRHAWRKWLNPLGRCVYCQSVWLCGLTIIVLTLLTGQPVLMLSLPFACGLSYVWVSLLARVI